MELAYSFRGSAKLYSCWGVWCHQADDCWRSRWEFSVRTADSRKRKPLGLTWPFETPKPIPGDTLPPTRPGLLQQGHNPNPFKWCQLLLTEHSSIWPYVGLPYSKPHSPQTISAATWHTEKSSVRTRGAIWCMLWCIIEFSKKFLRRKVQKSMKLKIDHARTPNQKPSVGKLTDFGISCR